jgi:hypothetical protein
VVLFLEVRDVSPSAGDKTATGNFLEIATIIPSALDEKEAVLLSILCTEFC